MKKILAFALFSAALTLKAFSQAPVIVERTDLPSYGTPEYMDLQISYTPSSDTKGWEMKLELENEPLSVSVPSNFVHAQTASEHILNGTSVVITPVDMNQVFSSGSAIVIDVLVRTSYDHYAGLFVPIIYK